jgi:arsenate reductase
VSIAEELGVDAEIVIYRKEPPDEATLHEILAKLEDPHTDLVRRDALFKKLELSDADVETDDQIVQVIVDNKMIMQRPLLVTADTAIIGRPKERVRELLAG